MHTRHARTNILFKKSPVLWVACWCRRSWLNLELFRVIVYSCGLTGYTNLPICVSKCVNVCLLTLFFYNNPNTAVDTWCSRVVCLTYRKYGRCAVGDEFSYVKDQAGFGEGLSQWRSSNIHTSSPQCPRLSRRHSSTWGQGKSSLGHTLHNSGIITYHSVILLFTAKEKAKSPHCHCKLFERFQY